jgi:cell division protein FtsL
MKRVSAAPVLPAIAAALLFAAVGIFHAWTRIQVVSAGYELARVEGERRRLTAEREQLRIEVATLRAPGRLEQFARTKLGMAPPAPGMVVRVGAGGKVGARGGKVAGNLPGPAEPVSSEGALSMVGGPRRASLGGGGGPGLALPAD